MRKFLVTLSVGLVAFFGLGQVSLAQAGPITSLFDFSSYSQSPFSLASGLTIGEAESYNGILYVAGHSGSLPAYQTVTFGAGGPTVSQVYSLPTLLPGGDGQVHDIQFIGGDVHFFGRSQSPNTFSGISSEATAWNVTTGSIHALGFGGGPGTTSTVFSASEAGIAVGVNGGGGSVHSLSGHSALLPPGGGAGGGGISADSSLIVGRNNTEAAFWRANDVAALDYVLHSTASFQQPGDDFFLGSFGLKAFNDPIIGEVGFFSTIDVNTFGSGVGAWNLTDGSLISHYGLGDLADAKLFGDELVIAMNSPSGAYLTTLSDPTRLYLTDLFGSEMGNLSFARGGLYDGSLGFIAFGENPLGEQVSFGVSYNSMTPVPEPSSFLLLALGGAALAARQRLSRKGESKVSSDLA